MIHQVNLQLPKITAWETVSFPRRTVPPICCWSVGRLVGWLMGWLVGWLVGCLKWFVQFCWKKIRWIQQKILVRTAGLQAEVRIRDHRIWNRSTNHFPMTTGSKHILQQHRVYLSLYNKSYIIYDTHKPMHHILDISHLCQECCSLHKFRNKMAQTRQKHSSCVRFQVLTAAIMKTIFWNISSCSVTELDRRFRGAYCLHHQGPDERRSIWTIQHGAISQNAFKQTTSRQILLSFFSTFRNLQLSATISLWFLQHSLFSKHL
jgi:hypothetical protein